jgi:hypothetical protein
MREAPRLLRSADEACVSVALSSSCHVDIPQRCQGTSAAARPALRTPTRRELCQWPHTDETAVCRLHAGHFYLELAWRAQCTPARVGEDTWAARMRCEGHPSFQVCITFQEEGLVSQKADIAHRPVLLTRLSARSTAKVRGRPAQRRLRYLFLPPHSPPFHAREEWWA